MHFYKRHLGDIAKKTAHLSPLEFGIYNLILDGYYAREQAPTLLEATRWARARTNEEKEAVLGVMDEFFTLGEDGRYRQARVEEEITAYHGKAETNRAIAIAREASKRARKEHDSCTSGVEVVHESGISGEPNHKPVTSNQEPDKEQGAEKTATGEKRGSRLPADWHPSEEDTAFCKANRPDLRPSEVARSFYDYWIGIPGAKGRKLDWSATWRNWVMKESAPAGRSAGRPENFRLDNVDHSSTAAAADRTQAAWGLTPDKIATMDTSL